MNTLLPVILCGGSGTRLWPLSREKHPKQLLMLGGDKHTMLQSTALRISCDALPGDWKLEHPLIVGQEECRFMTAEQLRQVDMAPSRILLEPVGRNTAPALTLAALAAVESEDDPVLVAMPADHVMLHPEAFCETLAQGLPLAIAGRVMTFGIVPTAPETGYGYIRCGEAIAGSCALEIMNFVEKPDIDTARRYLADGNYLWNSGIFMMRASTWLKQIDRFHPEILAACMTAMAKSTTDHDFTRVDKEAFIDCPSDSIDYAVMERLVSADEDAVGAVLPLDAGWSDVGAWSALWEIGEKDGEGNVLAGDVLAMDTRNSLVRAEGRMVACIGMDDTVVVETADAVLVAHRDHLHLVKDAVARLKSAGRSECSAHRKVQRPWGYYDSIDGGKRFQVKRIVVSPGACLSLQMHHHRAEHWVVVTGTARVTRGDEKFLLTENQSTYIPLGVVHRLENPGVVPLEIIEVQSGTYLGEDDIVRFEDFYGRDERLSEVIATAATISASAQAAHH